MVSQRHQQHRDPPRQPAQRRQPVAAQGSVPPERPAPRACSAAPRPGRRYRAFRPEPNADRPRGCAPQHAPLQPGDMPSSRPDRSRPEPGRATQLRRPRAATPSPDSAHPVQAQAASIGSRRAVPSVEPRLPAKHPLQRRRGGVALLVRTDAGPTRPRHCPAEKPKRPAAAEQVLTPDREPARSVSPGPNHPLGPRSSRGPRRLRGTRPRSRDRLREVSEAPTYPSAPELAGALARTARSARRQCSARPQRAQGSQASRPAARASTHGAGRGGMRRKPPPGAGPVPRRSRHRPWAAAPASPARSPVGRPAS